MEPHSLFTGSTSQILSRLELTVTHRLDGLLQGNHLGLVPGHGSELGETRPYVAGDDIRRIDWNVTARMQTPHIRQTIADRELETWVVVDHSPSMTFGTADCTKAELALAATAAVGFLTNHTGNRIGALISRPDGITVVPARSGRQHLLSLLHTVATDEIADGGNAELGVAVQRLSTTLRRRGLVVVVSDFLDPDGWQRPLRHVAVRHETLAVEIVDPRELDLPPVGLLSLVDPESGKLVHVDTSRSKTREAFARSAAAQRAAIASQIRKAGADHLQLRTDRDWVRDLVRFVALRRRRTSAGQATRLTR